MGCGGSKLEEIKTEKFEIEFLTLDNRKTSNDLYLKKIYNKTFETKPKHTIINYLKNSTETFIHKIFEENFPENKIKKSENKNQNFLCILYFWNSKFPKIKDFEYTKNFQPFEENILHEESKIKKLIVISMENFISLGIEKKDFYNELDVLIKADTSNFDIADKKLKLKSDEISIHESDMDDEKIHNELLQGIF